MSDQIEQTAQKPAKNKKNVKRIVAVLCAVVALALLVVGVGAIMNSVGNKQFTAAPADAKTVLKTNGSIDKAVAKLPEDFKETNKKLDELAAKAEPFGDDMKTEVEKVKQMYITYCKEVHDYDVTELMEGLKLYWMDGLHEEFSETAGAATLESGIYFNKGDRKGYMQEGNSDRLEGFLDTDFMNLLIHETAHYVILCKSDFREYFGLNEGFTEIIASKVAEYNQFSYRIMYYNVEPIADEIARCDPNIIHALVTSEYGNYKDYFTKTYGISFAKEYDDLLQIYLNEKHPGGRVLFGVQYYTAEIVKTMNNGSLFDFHLSIDPLFGLHYLMYAK